MKEEVCKNQPTTSSLGESCGGQIKEGKGTVRRWASSKRGRRPVDPAGSATALSTGEVVIKDVPAGICQFCGERYEEGVGHASHAYEAETIDKLNLLAWESKEGERNSEFGIRNSELPNKEKKGRFLDELVEDLYAEILERFDLEDFDKDFLDSICEAEYLYKTTDIPKELETAVSFYTDKAVKKLEEEIGKEKAKDASEIIFKLSMAAFISDAKLHNKSLDEVVSFLEDRKLRPRIIKAVEEGIIEGLRKGACLQEAERKA